MKTTWIPSLLLATVFVALVVGCSGDVTTPPASSGPPADDGDMTPMLIRLPPGVPSVPLATTSVSRRLTAFSGGELVCSGMRVSFPAGSLPRDMTVTLVVSNTEFVQLSLRPAGINLRSPAIIQLDDLTRTDGRAYLGGIAFYRQASPNPIPQPTSNDWRRPQAWVSVTGGFILGGTRWDISGMQPIRYLGNPGYTTTLVTVGSGGTVVHDRIKVTIPPYALSADTYITIHQESVNGLLVAELEPHGIQFRAPVTLEINLDGLEWQPYTDWTLWWLNDDTGVWEDQGGTFRFRKVTGQLWHFSDYSAGRAGW